MERILIFLPFPSFFFLRNIIGVTDRPRNIYIRRRQKGSFTHIYIYFFFDKYLNKTESSNKPTTTLNFLRAFDLQQLIYIYKKEEKKTCYRTRDLCCCSALQWMSQRCSEIRSAQRHNLDHKVEQIMNVMRPHHRGHRFPLRWWMPWRTASNDLHVVPSLQTQRVSATRAGRGTYCPYEHAVRTVFIKGHLLRCLAFRCCVYARFV